MALAIASSVGGGGTNHAADLHNVRVALNSIPIRKGARLQNYPPTRASNRSAPRLQPCRMQQALCSHLWRAGLIRQGRRLRR